MEADIYLYNQKHKWNANYKQKTKKKRIEYYIDWHLFTLTYIDLHWFILIYINLHWFILIYINLHWFILSNIDLHWLTLIYIDFHWFGFIHYYSFIYQDMIWTAKKEFDPLIAIMRVFKYYKKKRQWWMLKWLMSVFVIFSY